MRMSPVAHPAPPNPPMQALPTPHHAQAMARKDAASEAVDVVLDIAPPVLDLLEKGLELVPVPGLGLIPKALSAVVEQIKGARANKESYVAFEDQVKQLALVVAETSASAKNTVAAFDVSKKGKERVAAEIAQSPSLLSAMEGLKSTIRELETVARGLHRGGGFRAFCKGIIYKTKDEQTIATMREKLATAIELFQLRGHAAVDRGVEEIKRLLKEAELKAILDDDAKINLIPRVPAGFDAPGVAQLKEEFLEGTRTALFEKELDPWLADSYPKEGLKPIFFLSGGAGLGKSSITHHLCTRLRDPKRPARLGASYFFIRSDSSLASPAVFFSTLLHQLALARPSLRPSIVTAVRQYLEQGDPQGMETASKDILRAALLREPAANGELLFFVFDGLDECSERNILPQLVLALLALVRDVPWLRVFFASRPEPHVMAVLTSSDAHELVHHRSLVDTSIDSEKDVGSYIRHSVSQMPAYSSLLSAGSHDLERLVKRAGTSFIFARIALNFLETHRDYPEASLGILAQSEGGVGLKDLDTLYLQVLRRAYPPDSLRDIPIEHGHLLALLIIIALESDPDGPNRKCRPALVATLGTQLLQTDVMKSRISKLSSDSTAVMSFSEKNVLRMVDRLRSILLLSDFGEILPIHATFFEFLVNEQRCSDPLYHVSKLEGHAGLMAAWHALGATSYEATTRLLRGDRRSRRFLSSIKFKPPAWLYHCFHGAQFYQHHCWMEILRTLSTGFQIPILMRYYNTTQERVKEPPSSVIIPWIVKRSYVDATTPNAVELEFLRFALYSQLWWSTVLDPEYKDREITQERIAKLINNHFHTNIMVLPEDMARYRAAHEQLANMIDQDPTAWSEFLWYTNGGWQRPTHLWMPLDAEVGWDEEVTADEEDLAT